MTVLCHCTSQECRKMGGRELDYCTQKLHAQKNKACLVEKAIHAAEHVLEDQLK